MAETFKVLGQVVAGDDGGTPDWNTTLYTVPTKANVKYAPRNISQSIVSSLVVCNKHSGAVLYSVRVIPNGETGGDQHNIFYLKSIVATETHVVSLALGLQAGDSIMVSANVASVLSISAFGIEMV